MMNIKDIRKKLLEDDSPWAKNGRKVLLAAKRMEAEKSGKSISTEDKNRP